MGLPKCKDITRMVLEGEERRLGQTEQLLIRAHYLICKGCTNFGKQVELMRKASAQWRSYSGE
ncbi:zf-HC2 domain-containing protein [Paucibacter oligotrophus]|uniref:Zf-HC2 domain-containing protein n=2 Tax=Roseateles oligotrophus TaxID=1769250 RepID=A0ABT2YCP6_9BURK|nr:zf-HC2 domain-containing protein [Roseateles oligotrophus]